jgi:hypothetical protein
LSTEKLSCGGGPVARHAQAEIRLSVEESILRRKSSEKNKLRRRERTRNIQREESFKVSQN